MDSAEPTLAPSLPDTTPSGVAPPLDPSDRWERWAITAFVVFYLTLAHFWLAPSAYIRDFVVERLRPFVMVLGWDQTWSMFAPEPGHINFFIESRILYRNGRESIYPIGRLSGMNLAARLLHERDRKLVENWYAAEKGTSYYTQLALAMARSHPLGADNPPMRVQLVRRWSAIPMPPEDVRQPAPPNWREDVFYTMSLDPKALP